MNFFKYLFTTDIYNDTQLMPYKNKSINSVSSLWVLNLVSHSYFNNLNILTLQLFLISIFSSIFWYNYKINSIMHKLDKYTVISLFLYLSLNINYITFINNLCLIIPPFILSSISCIYNNYNIQLYSHQLFRYFAFKMIYNYININNDYYFLLITNEYILFTLYIYNTIIKNYKYHYY